MVDGVHKGACAEEDDYDRKGAEGVDGQLLLGGFPDEAMVGTRAFTGATIKAVLAYHGQVFECDQAKRHSLDADLQEEVEQIQI